MTYQDFDLVIERSGESLRAQVISSPAGQATAEFQLPFSEDKLENFLLRLGGRTRRATTRRVDTQEMSAAKTFGAALFSAVFSGDVKACFRSSVDQVRRDNTGLRIRLHLADPSVMDLPWEYLYNPAVNRFLALSIHTPVVRYMDLPERIQPISVTPPIRVLVMISSPTDFPALDVESEWTRLNGALADLIGKNQIAVERLDEATLDALQRRLRRERYHIFHFIGHGEFDEHAQEGVLILEGDKGRGHKVSSQSLGMMLHDHESLRVAILNACEGARTSRTDPFAGSAQSLVQQGIPAVIAMQFEIADDVASRFAHEFYGALADGYPIDASLTEARKSIFAARHEVEWGTPVLYLRAPDGRIFDVETVVPPKPLSAVDSGLQVMDSSTRLTRERITQDVITAARDAFADGRRTEAIDLLLRFGPNKEAVAEALRELTLEQQRLDESAARDPARELEQARRAQGEQERQAAGAQALALARSAIESSLAAADADEAERQLKAADSLAPGAELADLRARVVELRRAARAREDKRVDEVIAAARDEFTRSPAQAIERLAQFTPPHPRVTIVCRELKQLLTDHDERAARDVERRAAEARERQRQEERRQKDLREALQRITGYIDRNELPEAEAALQASHDAHGTDAGLAELRERLLAAQRKAETEAAARAVLGRARQLAQAEDHSAAIALLENFQPRHAGVDAALEALRHEADGFRRRREIGRRIDDAIARSEFEPSHRAAIAGLQEVLALDPDNATLRAAIKRRRSALRGSRTRAALSAVLRSRLTAAAALLAVATFVGMNTIPPLLSRWGEAPQRAQAPAASPPSSPPSATAVVPPADPAPTAPAPAQPDPAPSAAAPVDDMAELKRGVEQARARAEGERVRAVRNNASGLPRFRSADSSLARGAALAGTADYEGSVRAYDAAATQFRQAIADAEKPSANPVPEGNKGPIAPRTPPVRPSTPATGSTATAGVTDPAPIAKPAEEPAEPAASAAAPPVAVDPIPDPVRPDPPTATPPPAPLRPTIESALDAYARAMTRRDENALRAVYPTVPREAIDAWSQKDSGVRYSTVQIIHTREQFEGPTRVRLECTFFYNFITNPGRSKTIPGSYLVTLEKQGDNWTVVDSRKR